jgi:RNA polymerase sigma factor (sigma-70 family)
VTDAGWTALQQRLLMRYKLFKKRLTHYLGSADLAGDALQDTWLRLERGGELTSVRNPDTYLYSMAINIAIDHRRAEGRRLTTSEIETLLDVADDTPDAVRTVEARSDLDTLVTIIGELPVRQQAILLAARLDGMPRRTIAQRYGVSERFVQRELQEAHDYCAARLEKLAGGRFRTASRETSTGQKPIKAADGMPRKPGANDE